MVPPARVELASSAFSEQCTDRLYDSGIIWVIRQDLNLQGLEPQSSVYTIPPRTTWYRYRELNPNPQIRSLMPYPLGYTGSSARDRDRTCDSWIKSPLPYHLVTRAYFLVSSDADVLACRGNVCSHRRDRAYQKYL